MSRRKQALELLAYGPDVAPAERLRALELLREIEPVELPSEADRALRLALEIEDEGMLDRELDGVIASELVEAVESGGGNYPVTTEGLRALAKRWADEIADAGRIEQEIQRRAEERAAELYTDAGWRSLGRTLESVPDEAKRTNPAGESPEASEAVRELPTVAALAFPDELRKRPRRARRRRI